MLVSGVVKDRPDASFAAQLCCSSVCSHVLSALLYAFSQAASFDGDLIDEAVRCSSRSVWYLSCAPENAKKVVDLIEGDMLGRALVLSVETAARKAERNCPFWASCMSDLTMASSNCLMMSSGVQTKVMLALFCKGQFLNYLFYAGFGTRKDSHMHETLDEYVCRFASLLVQLCHKALLLEMSEIVTPALAEILGNHFFEAVCAYFASYYLRYRKTVSSRVLVALLSLLLFNCAFEPEILNDDKKRKSLAKVVAVASNYEVRGTFNEAVVPLIEALQKSIDERAPMELFSVFSPFEYSAGLLELDVQGGKFCKWCGMTPAVDLAVCSNGARHYCSLLCQEVYEEMMEY